MDQDYREIIKMGKNNNLKSIYKITSKLKWRTNLLTWTIEIHIEPYGVDNKTKTQTEHEGDGGAAVMDRSVGLRRWWCAVVATISGGAQDTSYGGWWLCDWWLLVVAGMAVARLRLWAKRGE